METEKLQTTLLHNFFIVLILCGLTSLFITFFVVPQEEFLSGIRQISLGILLIGIGEWINHPQQKSIKFEGSKDISFSRFQHRKRSSSSVGNLLEIVGIILIFTGLADYV